MRKRLATLLIGLLAAFSISVPAMAEGDGVIYDETGELWSQTLEEMSTEILPELINFYGIDIRIDLLTFVSEDSNIKETADYIYNTYDYGEGKDKNGVSLTIMLNYDGESYYINGAEDWCVYAGGTSSELIAVADEIAEELSLVLTPESFSGDIESDKTAVADVAYVFAGELLTMADEGRFAETIYNPDGIGRLDAADTAGGNVENEAMPIDEPDPEQGARLLHITDAAHLLTDNEISELEAKAEEVSKRRNCGIYIVTIDDYKELGYGDIYETAYGIYHDYNLGEGKSRNGAILLLSMNDRSQATFFYGNTEGDGKAFNSYSQMKMEDEYLDNLGDDDWYGGFEDFIEVCDEYLGLAENGTPVTKPAPSLILRGLAAAGIAAVISLIICLILKMSMKSVRTGAEANEYVIDGGLKLTGSRDVYTHTTQTRRKIEKSSSSGGGGGGSSSRSGGGGSGRSGNF